MYPTKIKHNIYTRFFSSKKSIHIFYEYISTQWNDIPPILNINKNAIYLVRIIIFYTIHSNFSFWFKQVFLHQKNKTRNLHKIHYLYLMICLIGVQTNLWDIIISHRTYIYFWTYTHFTSFNTLILSLQKYVVLLTRLTSSF